jgi:hypothetical protein
VDDWLPIETKPPFTHVEERGEYRTDDGTLWYFKPTHWRPIPKPTLVLANQPRLVFDF